MQTFTYTHFLEKNIAPITHTENFKSRYREDYGM
jgi:hypothetical protein